MLTLKWMVGTAVGSFLTASLVAIAAMLAVVVATGHEAKAGEFWPTAIALIIAVAVTGFLMWDAADSYESVRPMGGAMIGGVLAVIGLVAIHAKDRAWGREIADLMAPTTRIGQEFKRHLRGTNHRVGATQWHLTHVSWMYACDDEMVILAADEFGGEVAAVVRRDDHTYRKPDDVVARYYVMDGTRRIAGPVHTQPVKGGRIVVTVAAKAASRSELTSDFDAAAGAAAKEFAEILAAYAQ